MKLRYYAIALCSLLLSANGSAQDLNTEITVSHEVVPEEHAATRLRLLPNISLPNINAGRLPAASRFLPAQISPYILPLSPVGYLDSQCRYPFRGYAMLGYGPVYNLDGSLGYRLVEKQGLTVDVFGQFNGMSYKRGYRKLPAFMAGYDGKECFRRQAAAVGSNISWTSAQGTLTGSVLYQFTGYNFPILQLQMPPVTDRHQIDANQALVNLGWGSTKNRVDYSVGLNYSMIYLGKENANNNRVAANGALMWHSSSKSALGLNLGFSLAHSEIVNNKGIAHILPYYSYGVEKFKLKIGVDIDVCTGNVVCNKRLLIAPEMNLFWQPTSFFNIQAKISGRMDDNYRGRLFEIQPYLLANYDAGVSRIYDSELSMTFGPFRGGAIQIFGGYTVAKDWYIPAIETGMMEAWNVDGFHGGVAVNYDWRRYISTNLRFEIAQSPRGDYSRGYALWGDHARFNLSYNITARPIEKLGITLGYQLRVGRQKQLAAGRNMNLCNISNLTAAVNYSFTNRWSAFVRGENLLNQNWYLGPAVPCQGIMGMVGASYLF